MQYKSYQNARDTAWQILLECHIDRLPVDLNIVCQYLGVKVFSYQKVQDMVRHYALEDIMAKTDGLAFYSGEQPVILYNGSLYPPRIRFTIAHEIGHLVLCHVMPGQVTLINRDPHPTDAPEETAANQFAARLLAPACVLWGLGLHTPDAIARQCDISRQAAEFRATRMEELYKRDKFLTSPLERAVYQQFQPFIRG